MVKQLHAMTPPGTGKTRAVPRLNVCNQRNVPWLLRARAESRADHPFVVWAPFDRDAVEITYAEFYQRVMSLAAGLRDRGVSQGDFVLLHMENCPEFLQTWHACSQLGAVVVTTNTRSSAEELGYFIDHCNAKAAITQPAFLASVSASGPGLEWVACLDHDAGAPASAGSELGYGVAIPFEELMGDAGSFQPVDSDPLDWNSVQYTSPTPYSRRGVTRMSVWSAPRISAMSSFPFTIPTP